MYWRFLLVVFFMGAMISYSGTYEDLNKISGNLQSRFINDYGESIPENPLGMIINGLIILMLGILAWGYSIGLQYPLIALFSFPLAMISLFPVLLELFLAFLFAGLFLLIERIGLVKW